MKCTYGGRKRYICMMLIKMALTLSVIYSNHLSTFVNSQENESNEFQSSDISDFDYDFSTVINYLENDLLDGNYEDEFSTKINQPLLNDEDTYRNNSSQREFERDLRTFKLKEVIHIKRGEDHSFNSAILNGTEENNKTSTDNSKNQANGTRLTIHIGTPWSNRTSTENRQNQANSSRLAINNGTQETSTISHQTSTENRKIPADGSNFGFKIRTQNGNITFNENRKNQATNSSLGTQNKIKEGNATSTDVSKNQVNSSSSETQNKIKHDNVTSTEASKNRDNSSILAPKDGNVTSTEVSKNHDKSLSLATQNGVQESSTLTITEKIKQQVSGSSLEIQNEVGKGSATEEEKKCMYENISCSKCASLSPNCHYHHKEKKCFYSNVVHGNDIYECGARYFAQDGWMPLLAAVGVVSAATVGVVAFVGWEVYQRCIKKHAIPQEETEEMRSQIMGIRARRSHQSL